MPVHCILRDNKWRIVDSNDKIEKTNKGNARDGGGHETKAKCDKQARAINMNISDSETGDSILKEFFP